MNQIKPSCKDAMLSLIIRVRKEFPFEKPESQICGTSCIGCPKKLLEIVDTDLCEWESKIDNGINPTLNDLHRLAKLCKNIKRGLSRNNLL